MSKGSKQRPTNAQSFAANYDAIFRKKPILDIDGNPVTVFKDAHDYAMYWAMKNSVAPKTTNNDKVYSIESAIAKWGTSPFKVWDQHEDGSITPSRGYSQVEDERRKALDAADLEAIVRPKEVERVCGNCRHWERYKPASPNTLATLIPEWTKRGECLGGLAKFIDSPGGASFDPHESFGCNKFEAKV